MRSRSVGVVPVLYRLDEFVLVRRTIGLIYGYYLIGMAALLPDHNELLSEIEALKERLSRLSEASRHINESLEFDTVLQGVLDSARSLTDARYGIIALLGETGSIVDFLASGMSKQEGLRLWELPIGPKIFEHLRNIREPFRVSDLESYFKSLALEGVHFPFRAKAFLAAPMRHQGEDVGFIYLGNKERRGREFSLEDEKILVMFASQAALVIANARQHRQEQRARADLEAVVNTSPVGVVVLNARTGKVVSRNQEARRIVGDLRVKSGSLDHLLEVVTVRRADGRELSLEELPVAQVLISGETVRAEEIIIEVPDGRRVTTLVNATPIRDEQGDVQSVVVTMQDMTPVEELQRLRAEFLGIVCHELRTPLTTIKGSAATMLGTPSPLHPDEARQFFDIIDSQADHMRDLISNLLDVSRIATGTLSINPESVEAVGLIEQAKDSFLRGGARRVIDVAVDSDLPMLNVDRQRLLQVLGNLLTNASKYSHNMSTITLRASRQNFHIVISVTDQGRGISAEHLPFLFKKFSRIQDPDQHDKSIGDGLGLAICKGIVEAHGGRIWATSDGPGKGAQFSFTLPIVEETASGPVISSEGINGGHRQGEVGGRVLVVDDDLQILRYVSDTLVQAGYKPITTGNPKEVGHLIRINKPQLVLLDLILPDTDGISLLKETPEMADIPIIFLSGYGQDEIITRALQAGAADYIVKPFSPTELIVRIKTVFRPPRGRKGDHPRRFQIGDLAIQFGERIVTLADQPVHLTATEHQLLEALSVNAGRAVSHDELLTEVYGTEHAGDPRVIRSFMKTLRRKLGDNATKPKYILTERGFGYRIATASMKN